MHDDVLLINFTTKPHIQNVNVFPKDSNWREYQHGRWKKRANSAWEWGVAVKLISKTSSCIRPIKPLRVQYGINLHECKLIPYWKSKRFDYLLIMYWKKYFITRFKLHEPPRHSHLQLLANSRLSGLCGHCQVSCHTMHNTSDPAFFLLRVIGLFWIALFLGQSDCIFCSCNCTEFQLSARNYTFFHRFTK